jgi:hypothetical protein
MDYLKHYNSLIETRNNRKEIDNYYEKHHIIPKCMGGTNDQSNLINLTFKEHYMAHYLLSKIYPKNAKIQYAFLCMLRNPRGQRILTSKMYSTIKHNYKNFCLWYRKINKPKITPSGRQKLKEKMMGNNNPMRKFPEKNTFKGKSYVVGRKWYNNGKNNLYLNINEEIPPGYFPGMKSYKRIRNGVDSSHYREG